MSDGRERLFIGYSGQVLISISVGWTILQMGRFLLPTLLPQIISSLEITLSKAGFALTVFQLVYSGMQYPGGRFSDELSRATLILPGLLILVMGFFFISIASVFSVFLIGAIVLGLGKAFFTIPSRALLSDHFVERRGQALGIFSAGSDLGGSVAAAVGASFFVVASWRLSFISIAVLLFFVTIVYVLINQEEYVVGWVALDIRSMFRRLSMGDQRDALLAYSFYLFVGTGMVNFFPTYLTTAKNMTPATAGYLFSLFFITSMISKPMIGKLSDHVSRRVVATGGFLLSAFAILLLMLGTTIVTIIVAVCGFSVGNRSLIPIMDTLIIDAAPSSNTGGDLGGARTILLSIGSLGPIYLGVVAQAYDYDLAFVGFAIGLVVAGLLLARG